MVNNNIIVQYWVWYMYDPILNHNKEFKDQVVRSMSLNFDKNNSIEIVLKWDYHCGDMVILSGL